MDWTVFQKPGVESKPERQPNTTQKPAKQQPGRQQQSSRGEEEKHKIDLGEDVDFDALSDDEKKYWNFVCSNYKGNTDPQQWCLYWSQKQGWPYEGILRPATILYNLVHSYNMNSIEQVPEQELHKFPWWSASRNWNPDSAIWGNKQWGGTNSILDAVSSRF